MRAFDVYNRAIRLYGQAHQMFKAKSECVEFLDACMKLEEGRGSREDVIGEIADVIITIQQARLIMGADAVDLAVERKLRRLVSRMDKLAGAQP